MDTNKGKSEKVTDTDAYPYENVMGEWVTARCLKCTGDHGGKIPKDVKKWLKEGGNSPPNENTDPTLAALAWLIKTIIDPVWPVP